MRSENLQHLLTALLILNLAGPVAAQESPDRWPGSDAEVVAEDEFGEEIVVTARRREEDLQKIPISVTALSADELEARSLVSLDELDNFTPNLVFNTTGGFGDEASESAVFMRGVGQLVAQRFNTDSGVGIYVDGVFVSRSQGAVFDLLDLERVEVLRGPQGTLFGRNAIGGAINLVTRRPSAELKGRLTATTGEFNRADLSGSVAGPLTDKLSGGLTLITANRDGFSESLFSGQEFGDVNYDAGRTSWDVQPTSNVSVRLTGDYTRKREAGANMLLRGVDQVEIVDFFNRVMTAAGRLTYTDQWVSDSTRFSFSGFPSFIDSDVYGTSVSAAWTGDSVSLQSITSFRGFDVTSHGDGDGSPPVFAERERTQRQDQFSQELQLSGLAGDKLNWQTGLLYFRERPRESGRGIIFRDLTATLETLPGPIVAPPGVPDFLCNPGPPPPGLPCFGGAGNPLNQLFAPALGFVVLDMTTVSTAAFGEGSYALSDRAELTAGLRYSRDEKEMSRFGVESPLGDPPPLGARTDEDSWSAWTPRVSFSFQAKPDVLLYATASRGFKSGGFDTTILENTEGFPSFKPELMWTYEAGVKSQFFGHRLKLNQSTFWSDYENIQFVVAEVLDGIPVAVVKNAGTAEIFGFELELEAHLAEGLVLNVGAGYTDAELVEIDPGSGVTIDALFPQTPEWNYSVALQYAATLAKGSLIARADYGWRDDFFFGFENDARAFQEAYGIVNARVLYAPSSRWEVALFGTNLTDEDYFESALRLEAVGTTLGVGARPREWGATVEIRW